MSQLIQGTFATGQVAAPGNTSDVLVIPSSTTVAKLTTVGLDASNTIKTQKITAPGTAWADQTTYNSDQSNVSVTVAAGEQWRIVQLAQQAIKDVRYKFSCES